MTTAEERRKANAEQARAAHEFLKSGTRGTDKTIGQRMGQFTTTLQIGARPVISGVFLLVDYPQIRSL